MNAPEEPLYSTSPRAPASPSAPSCGATCARAAGASTPSWIDEAGPGETKDLGELWCRIEREVHAADGLIPYVEANDLPLQGALVEVGLALADGKFVAVVLPKSALGFDILKSLGSWVHHPCVDVFTNLEAVRCWIGGES